MPPKKGKKTQMPSEQETVTFEQQISDATKQLERLRSRNEYLENECEILKGKLENLEEDRSDVVAHLKRILQQKTEESRELSDRLLAMEELRREEQIAFKKREESLLSEHHTMETNLTAEIKLLTGKLNSLEDWRLARIELTRKFEDQEERMAEQEERHKRTLYEAEKSLIIGRAKMQREMEERCNELAQSFRETMNLRIADATHRAVRENVALNIELDAVYKLFRKLEEETREHKEKERNFRMKATLSEAEAQMVQKKLIALNRLIDELAKDHESMRIAREKMLRDDATAFRKEKGISECREKIAEEERKARIVEQNIQVAREERDDIFDRNAKKESCAEISRLENILKTAKRFLMENLEKYEESASTLPDLDEKMGILLNILEEHEIPEIFDSEGSSLIEGPSREIENFQENSLEEDEEEEETPRENLFA